MTERPGSRGWDRAIEVVLVVLLAYLPFAFGGVLPLSHAVIAGVAAAMVAMLGLRTLFVPGAHVVWTWGYVPVALFLGLVAFQLVPLPVSLVAALSPQAAEVWTSHAVGTAPEAATLSIYPTATWVDARLLLAAGALLFVVVNVFRSTAQVQRLLTAISVIGMAVVGWSLVQHATGTRTIFWIWDVPGAPNTGPFVHAGHFCQYISLSLGCGFGVLLLRLMHRYGRDLRLRDLYVGLLMPGRRFDLALVALILLGMIVIALSTSRNGLIAMLVASAVTALLLERSRVLTGFGWSIGGLVLIAFVALLLFGFDPIYERMSTLEDADQGVVGRIALLRDTISLWSEYPALGSGQGTFEWAFPMFDESMRPGTAEHAENQYGELLAETGLVGFVLITATFIFAGIGAWRTVRARRSPLVGCVLGMVFGVVAVLFHATTDFGLRIPAIAALVTVFTALFFGLSVPGRKLGTAMRIAVALLCFAMAGLLATSLPDTLAVRAADNHARAADEILHYGTSDSTEDYDRYLEHLSAAAELQPTDTDHVYDAAMAQWRRAVVENAAVVENGTLTEAKAAEQLRAFAEDVRNVLLAATRHAPTDGRLWASAGELSVGWLDDATAGRWIHRGYRLAPHNPDVCLAEGRQMWLENDQAAAVAAYRRALHVGARWQDLQDILIDELRAPQLLREVARGNAQWLLWLRPRLEAMTPVDAELIADVRDEAHAILVAQAAEPDAPAWMLVGVAREYARREEFPAAIAAYRNYLTSVPRSTERFALAQVLVAAGQKDEAAQELERLLRIRRDHAGARALLKTLERAN